MFITHNLYSSDRELPPQSHKIYGPNKKNLKVHDLHRKNLHRADTARDICFVNTCQQYSRDNQGNLFYYLERLKLSGHFLYEFHVHFP